MGWAGLGCYQVLYPRCDAFGRKSRPLASLTAVKACNPCSQPADNCPCPESLEFKSSRRSECGEMSPPSFAEAASAPIPRTTLRNLGSGPTTARGMQATYDSLSKGLPRGHPKWCEYVRSLQPLLTPRLDEASHFASYFGSNPHKHRANLQPSVARWRNCQAPSLKASASKPQASKREAQSLQPEASVSRFQFCRSGA